MVSAERTVVAFFPDKIAVGEQFKNWPLHLTLIPPTTLEPESISSDLTPHAGTWEPIPASVGKIKLFGTEDDLVEGHLIEPEDSIRRLHISILETLGGLSVIHNGVEEWLGDQYTPHITCKSWQRDIAIDETFIIDRVAIVGKDAGVRTVRHILRLGLDSDET